MVKTGNYIFTVLSLMALIAPLLPVFLVFKRRAPLLPVLRILIILCLLVFVQQLLLFIPIIPGSYSPVVLTVFHLGDFVLICYLFRMAFPGKVTGELMNLLLVALVSVCITIYALRGIQAYTIEIALAEAAIPAALALAVLMLLIRNRQIVLFREVLFWIAGGTLCYSGMYLYMEFIIGGKYEPSQAMQDEKEQFLLVTHIIRFVFFALAISVTSERLKTKEKRIY